MEKNEEFSNKSEYEISIDSMEFNLEDIEKDNNLNDSLNKSLDFKESTIPLLNLKIENEISIKNEIDLNLKTENRFRSVSQNPIYRPRPEYVPKPKPKENNEYIPNFKLCIRTFGKNDLRNDRITVDVLNEYEKDIIDSYSCPDIEEKDDYDYYFENLETQKNSLVSSNISDMRKSMSNFRKSIDSRNNNEFENILCLDNILKNKEEKKKDNYINKEKDEIITRIIKQQIEENKIRNSYQPFEKNLCLDNKNISSSYKYQRNYSMYQKVNTYKKKKNNISILGIIKSAMNEKKYNNKL
jgi:hypothetical protein